MYRNTLLLYWLVCAMNLAQASWVLGQWPQFGGIRRDFQATPSSPTEELRLGTWSLSLGNGDAAPVVDNNLVFVTEASFTEDGQEALQVRCVDPRQGNTLWKSQVLERSYPTQDISEKYPIRPMASPIAIAGKLITLGYGGCVACLEQSTGQIDWQHDLVAEFGAKPLQYGWSSSPWSDGKNVILACGGPKCLALALDLHSGIVSWQSSAGEAAYGSFTELVFPDQTRHLCYIGRDEVVGLNPGNGALLWTFPLPKPQLTNAVTPLALAKGHVLVAGQGSEGTRQLQVEPHGSTWQVTEVWKSKPSPFYCNWLVDDSTGQLFGLHSNVLLGVDLDSGKTKWKQRGWTDANFAMAGQSVIGIRGDGLLAVSKLTQQGLEVQSGARVLKDRVWAPPVIIGSWALLRGRTTLACVDWTSLPKIDTLPSGTQVDSMTAMYGEKPEKIVALRTQATQSPATMRYEDYHKVVEDRANQFADSDYRSLLEALQASPGKRLQLQIAEDWCARHPNSIMAVDTLISLLDREGDSEKVKSLIESRFVKVNFDVTLVAGLSPQPRVYVTGNAAALGSWSPTGTLLTRSEDGHYRGEVYLPRGDLEFKVTRGDWDTAEVASDGKKLSNRRRRIVRPTTIAITVEAWSSGSRPK